MTTTTETQTFSVPAISCDHCVNAITSEVSAIPEVQQVDVDVATKLVTVVGGQRETIIAAIDEAGYDVTD